MRSENELPSILKDVMNPIEPGIAMIVSHLHLRFKWPGLRHYNRTDGAYVAVPCKCASKKKITST